MTVLSGMKIVHINSLNDFLAVTFLFFVFFMWVVLLFASNIV